MTNRYLQADLENRRKLAEVIRKHQPDFLFGPAMPDYHPDHVEAAKLVEAARFEAKFHKTDMKGTPHWTARLFGYFSTHRPDYPKPSFIVDITNYWDKKIKAIQAYQSQIKDVSDENPVSLIEKVEVVCRYFGHCIGSRYGEPFIAHEPVGVRNIELLTDFQ